MCFATLLPLGILQLRYSVGTGYFEARQLTYVTNSVNTIIEWGRMPGDLIFILGGVLPYLYIAFLGLRNWASRADGGHLRRGCPLRGDPGWAQGLAR